VRHLSIASAIAALVLASVPARAGGVGVAAVSTTSTDPVSVRKALAAVVGEGRSVRVSDDAIGEARGAVASGAVPVAALERFRRLREQIDEGWRAFVRVQVDFAASRLAAARTEAESLVALPGGAILYADAALRLGAVLDHLGRIAESQAILALALALDPDRPITLAEFSPDIVGAVDAVRAQTRPRAPVRIASEPPGATISVDGKDIGRTPLEADLVIGQHVVVARLPQFHPHALAVAIDASSREVTLDLDRDVAWSRLAEGASAGEPESAAQELVDATLRFADLDELVLAADSDRRGGPALLVQRCAGSPARCTAVVEVGYGDRSGLPAAAREAWQSVKTADLRYPPSVFGDARLTGRRTDEGCKLCKSPYLWGGLGVAAVVATVVVIAVVSGSRPPPVVVADPGQF
jgi:hypothetical protein